MAGRGALGFASGDGAISRVGHRAEEHPILFVLPAVDLLFSKLGRAVQPASDAKDKAHPDV